jgi:transcriptional regulator with XRE-family HTH domain
MQNYILWIMKKHSKSRQEEAIAYYRKGFSQSEIAKILGVNQSTVSRYFNNPTKAEIEDFYVNYAYGARVTETGKKIVFNRRYQDIEGSSNEKIVKTEYYYNDGTFWPDRFYHSVYRIPVFDSTESWNEYIKLQKEQRKKKRKLWGWS